MVFTDVGIQNSVDRVLCILKSQYAYEKCSSDVGDSSDIKNSDTRRANQNIRKEKAIFIDSQKNGTPMMENVV